MGTFFVTCTYIVSKYILAHQHDLLPAVVTEREIIGNLNFSHLINT